MANISRLTLPDVLRMLKSKIPTERDAAIEELEKRGPEANGAISELVTLLDKWDAPGVRAAAVHALASIDPDSPITGARAGQVIVQLLCEFRSWSHKPRVKDWTKICWADFWAGEGLQRIIPFGIPVRRALVVASAGNELAVRIAAQRVLKAWDRATQKV